MGKKGRTDDFVNLQDCFRMITEMVTDGIFEYDVKKDVMLYIDSKSSEYSQKLRLDNFSAQVENYVHEEDIYSVNNLIFEMKIGIEEIRGEFRWRGENDQYTWMAIQGNSLYTKGGKPQYVIGRMYNLENQRNNEIKIFKDNQRDSLTRLYNKKNLENHTNLYMKEHKDERCAVLVVDIDDFKWINDNLGYLFGDEVLANAAKTIQDSFAGSDLVGRIGGDEFLVFMKDVQTLDYIANKAEKLLQKIQGIYTGEKRQQGITASIGIAVFPDHGVSYEDLQNKAKQALHYVKRNEKKSYMIYDDEKKDKFRAPYIKSRSSRDHYTTFEKNKDKDLDGFGHELTDFAFELMEETKDVDSVVNLLLHKVANYYKFPAIYVRLTTELNNTLKYVYEFSQDHISKMLTHVKTYTDIQWKTMTNRYQEGIYHIIPVTEKIEPDFFDLNLGDCRFSSLQMPLYSNDQFIGCIDFCDGEVPRNWKSKDVRTLKIFSRIITAYLLNMKAYNLARISVNQMIETDSLTGLWKYEKFLEKLNDAMQHVDGSSIVIVYSDIRHFKYINDTYGYRIGDELLRSFSKKIMVGSEHIIGAARVYSDNIVLACYLEEGQSGEDFRDFVESYNKMIEEDFQLKYYDGKLSICTGLYIIKDFSMEAEAAISNANLARKTAKRDEKLGAVLFSDDYILNIKREMELVTRFPNALKNGELIVYYQPKVECGSSKIAGAEALIRWQTEKDSFIYPDEFIPLLESNGSIVDLDYFVYDQVFSFIRRRMDQGKTIIPISMNVSRIHMENNNLIDFVINLFDKYQVPPELVEFELTENIYIDNPGMVMPKIESLRSLGVKISMDDFGSGYSSLNLLTKLPIDIIKLDKVFLKNAVLEDCDEILIRSIVEMAKKLHLSVICEGVENQEHAHFLSRIGCDLLQGYYFGHPMPLSDFEKYIVNHMKADVQEVTFAFQDNLMDSTGKYRGTIVGQNVEFTDGPHPGTRALHFPGGLPGVEILELPTSVYMSESYTTTMWLLEEESSIWTSVFYTAYDNGFSSIIPRAYDMNSMFRIKDEKDVSGWYDAGLRKAPDQGWNFIAATYDAKNRLSGLYLNGINAGMNEAACKLLFARRVIVGGDIYQKGFKGSIANLKFYSQALSQTEIRKRYKEETNHF